MEDHKIVDLYWQRSEHAISETETKYGRFCYSIAYRILENIEDSEECVSDTYLAAWNEMPPKRPSILAPFLGKITRNLSINRWRSEHAIKRGGGEIVMALDELKDCIADPESVEETILSRETIRIFNHFLDGLFKTQRDIFLRRYWLMDPIAEIAENFGYSESKVKSVLFRARGKLRQVLLKEGIL